MAFLLCVPLAAGTLGAVSACTPDDAGDGSAGGTVAQSETADAEPVSFTGLDQVTVTDGYAVNALEKEADYLLLLDADRLLAGFYANSSLGSNGSSMYGAAGRARSSEGIRWGTIFRRSRRRSRMRERPKTAARNLLKSSATSWTS